MGSLDRRVGLALFLVVSLAGTTAWGQELDLRKVDYSYWSTLTYGEQMSYVNGLVGGTYALALVYMYDNQGLGGPNLFDYAPMDVYNTRLVEVVNQVYRERRFREVAVAAICINYRYWVRYLGGGNGN